jgi:RNA polymerase sigma-70 factor (ECF subfamily)
MTLLADRPDTWAQVEAAQAGDMAAFALIYQAYHDQVLQFVYHRIGGGQVAEDLCATTFERALRSIGTVSWQGKDIGAWLIVIARNLVADHFKSSRYRLEVTTGDVLDADRADDTSPYDAAVNADRYATLRRAVDQLNPEQRQCIQLRFFEYLTVAETAQAMNKNEGAIKAMQYRAVLALQRALKGTGVA